MTGIADFPTYVNTWSPVLRRPYNGGVDIAFLVVHVGVLWLIAHTCIETQFLVVIELSRVAVHQVCIVVPLFVCGILAVHLVQSKGCQVYAVFAQVVNASILQLHLSGIKVVSCNCGQFSVVCKSLLDIVSQGALCHHGAVAVLESALQLIADLQVASCQQGFAIAHPSLIPVCGRGSKGILVSSCQRLAGCRLEIPYHRAAV